MHSRGEQAICMRIRSRIFCRVTQLLSRSRRCSRSWLHAFSFRHWLKDRLLRQRAKWISSIRSCTVAVASCASCRSCHKSMPISESQSHHCLASCPKEVGGPRYAQLVKMLNMQMRAVPWPVTNASILCFLSLSLCLSCSVLFCLALLLTPSVIWFWLNWLKMFLWLSNTRAGLNE